MRRWRKATWLLAIWTVFMLLWLATALRGIDPTACDDETGAALAVCREGASLGVDPGAILVVAVAFVGFIGLGLAWLRTRPTSSPLP